MKKLNSKKIGMDYEKKIAKSINSGSLWFDKGDIKTETHLIECKYTDKKSFRITTKILKKIFNEAFEQNKLPALIIGIQDNEVVWNLKVEIERKVK